MNPEIIAKLQLAQLVLSDALSAIQASQPAAPVETTPEPIVEPVSPPAPIPVPNLTANPDGTITVSGADNLVALAWSYEAQTNGWVASGQGEKGVPFIFTPSIAGTGKVKACFVSFGDGGEINAQGEDSILEL